MKVYRIVNWSKYFEVNRTRELKYMTWVPMPNKHDGEGFVELITEHANGLAHYGAWSILVQIASRCEPRGTLLRDGKSAMTSQGLARKSHVPAGLWDEALPRFIKVGWLEHIHLDDKTLEEIPHGAAGKSHPPAPRVRADTVRNGTVRNGTEGEEPSPPDGGSPGVAGPSASEFQSAWNEIVKTPRCEALTQKRRRALAARMNDGYWRTHWRKAMGKIPQTPFLRGENDRGWTASIDWFLRPDSVARILEGQYGSGKAAVDLDAKIAEALGKK